jgi:hypothetical protein
LSPTKNKLPLAALLIALIAGLGWFVLAPGEAPTAPARADAVSPAAAPGRATGPASAATGSGPASAASTLRGTPTRLARELVRVVWPLGPDQRLSSTDMPRLETVRFDREVPAVFLAFDRWLDRYAASAPAGRPALLAEGLALLKERALAWPEFARADPEAALLLAPSGERRAALPADFVALLEQPVSGAGFYGVLSVCRHGAGTDHDTACEIRREVVLDGAVYEALIYGARRERLTEEDASLFGFAMGKLLVLHEDEIVVESSAAAGSPYLVHHRGLSLPVSSPAELAPFVNQLLSR